MHVTTSTLQKDYYVMGLLPTHLLEGIEIRTSLVIITIIFI